MTTRMLNRRARRRAGVALGCASLAFLALAPSAALAAAPQTVTAASAGAGSNRPLAPVVTEPCVWHDDGLFSKAEQIVPACQVVSAPVQNFGTHLTVHTTLQCTSSAPYGWAWGVLDPHPTTKRESFEADNYTAGLGDPPDSYELTGTRLWSFHHDPNDQFTMFISCSNVVQNSDDYPTADSRGDEWESVHYAS